MIFQDGLIYFIIVLLINVPAAVIAALDLNPVMDTISSTLVSVASVVTSGYAVRHLSKFSSNGIIMA
ncbi:hypothetical protein NLI96_g2528 [Meripilus lineatus]|uniref:Uncharacterized protein n=1 Tax=Meripilus lineatus TaxID=2056292 RepID=A0AAD5V8I4_9APHY|nr:hypothetical protein NLI96_g2528 [Physisporinus lineatus]